VSFVHLHVHSHYSIGRAVPCVRSLVQRAAHLEMPSIALTDNNSIAGLHELDEAAREFGIRPILGCELDVLPSDHGVYQGRTHRIVLLMEKETGYRNLVRLLTLAHAQPPDFPPHVRFSDLERHLGGLILLTGSPRSELYHCLREGDSAMTKKYLNRLANAAGSGNLFFEVLEYPHPRIRKIMDYVLELSRFLNIPAVASQNIHFLDPKDMAAYCALVQFPRSHSPQWPLPDHDLPTRHFTTPADMQKRFGFTPEILEQSLRIAERCAPPLPRHRAQVPVPDLDRGQDPPTLLWDKAIQGATRRYGDLTPAIKDRLNSEFGDIRGLDGRQPDLAEHLLFLQDISDFLRQNHLPRGVGRGKWLTSVVAFTLGITQIDPLEHRLDYQPLRSGTYGFPLFEIETSANGMDQVLQHLRDQYGVDNVVAVGRRVDWRRNDLFQHLCRWAGLPVEKLRKFPPEKTEPAGSENDEEDDETSLASISPETFQQHADEEIESLAPQGSSHASWTQFAEIPGKQALRRHPGLAQVTYALHPCPRGFEPQRHHYTISREPVSESIPVLTTATRQKSTQAEAFLLDQLHLPRVQFTNLGQLNILHTAQQTIQEDDPDFTLADIPPDDETTHKVLGLGLTNGVAPLHSITTKSLLRAHGPRDLHDLCEVSALARKRKPDDVPPDLIEILPDTLLAYQTAYLKVHHPVAFMVSLLTHTIHNQKTPGHQRSRFQILLREARKMEIKILGPDINFSLFPFTQERGQIRTGLLAVQGLGRQTYHEIESVRTGSAFTSLADFCHRTDPRSVNQSQIVSLIKSGAFDNLDSNRTKILLDFERALKNARRQNARHSDSPQQLQLFDPAIFDEDTATPETEQSVVPPPERDQIMRYEQESLGYSATFDLLDHYETLMRAMHAVSPFEINSKHQGKTIYVAGFIDHSETEGPLIDADAQIVLDLEGKVVKVPPVTVPRFEKIRNTEGPVLVYCTVQSHSGNEMHLVAHDFHMLEDIDQKARQVHSIRLLLAGENRKTLSQVRDLLKTYRGPTRIELEGRPNGGFWTTHSIESARVYLCPPLYQGLTRLISPNRLRFLDAQGRRLTMGGEE